MVKDSRADILDFIKRKGPVLPVQVSKEISTDILMAGAILSELVSSKKIIISNTKKGGSPFYYLPGQEHRLQEIAQFLSGKEKEAYDMIKAEKVIRDKDAEPWQRVALRSINDFASPLSVTMDKETEIFWKWYLLSNEEAGVYIKQIIAPQVEVKEEIKEKAVEEAPKEVVMPQVIKKEETKIEEKKKEIFVEKKEKKEEVKEKREIKKREKTIKKEESKINEIDFYNSLKHYFASRNMKVYEEKIIKKNKEINFVAEVPSQIGLLKYFVKCKNKKSISDADLSLAFGEGQQKKIPVLFLSNGKLSKKAIKYIEDNLKGQLAFKKINE